jgi:hypothetical protein
MGVTRVFDVAPPLPRACAIHGEEPPRHASVVDFSLGATAPPCCSRADQIVYTPANGYEFLSP